MSLDRLLCWVHHRVGCEQQTWHSYWHQTAPLPHALPSPLPHALPSPLPHALPSPLQWPSRLRQEPRTPSTLPLHSLHLALHFLQPSLELERQHHAHRTFVGVAQGRSVIWDKFPKVFLVLFIFTLDVGL